MGKPKGKASKKARRLAKKRGILQERQEAGAEDKAEVEAEAGEPVDDRSKSKYSIQELLNKAEELVDRYEYDLGRQFCQRALEMDADNVRALELTSTVLLEAGDTENARHCLGRAITVQPDEGHSKFLAMAQLFQGREALDLYNSGIRIMLKAREECQDESRRKEISTELSSAYCACAELFMTDLCDEEKAEEECKEGIARAEEACPTNAEAKQTKARFLLVKQDFEGSKTAIRESLDLWLPNYQAVLENRQGASSSSGASFDPVECCPLLYTTRIAAAKILIELEMWDEAAQVLEGLLAEDDEVVETWYLLGWLNKLRAEVAGEDGYEGNARFYLSKAREAQKKNPTDDADMVAHIEEVLEELGPGEEDEEEEEGEGKDWEDVETSSDEEEEMEQS